MNYIIYVLCGLKGLQDSNRTRRRFGGLTCEKGHRKIFLACPLLHPRQYLNSACYNIPSESFCVLDARSCWRGHHLSHTRYDFCALF